jgi:hypothetical protein
VLSCLPGGRPCPTSDHPGTGSAISPATAPWRARMNVIRSGSLLGVRPLQGFRSVPVSGGLEFHRRPVQSSRKSRV